MRPVRAVVADDSALLRHGVVTVLQAGGVDVVAQATDADQLVTMVRTHRPDVAVVDIRMPPTHTDDGLRAAHQLRRELPGLGVLVLSQYLEPAYATELLADGTEGVGYLLKDRIGDLDWFLNAVRQVAAGGSVLDPDVIDQLLGRRHAADPLAALSPREREVLALMAEGRTNAAIASSLYLSAGAVEKHTTAIFTKLRLHPTPDDHRRVLAVLTYLQT